MLVWHTVIAELRKNRSGSGRDGDADTIPETISVTVQYSLLSCRFKTYNKKYKKNIWFFMWACDVSPQSRQSAGLFLQSSELGPPPLARRRVLPPFGSGGGILACGRGGVRTQFGRRDRHCGIIYLYHHPVQSLERGFVNKKLAINMYNIYIGNGIKD